MRKWLGLLATLALVPATAVVAQVDALPKPDVASVARAHQIDLRLSQQQGNERPLPLIRGMIVQQEVAAGASIGLGLANLYGRRKNGSSGRPGDPPAYSRKPAITFMMKF